MLKEYKHNKQGPSMKQKQILGNFFLMIFGKRTQKQSNLCRNFITSTIFVRDCEKLPCWHQSLNKICVQFTRTRIKLVKSQSQKWKTICTYLYIYTGALHDRLRKDKQFVWNTKAKNRERNENIDVLNRRLLVNEKKCPKFSEVQRTAVCQTWM